VAFFYFYGETMKKLLILAFVLLCAVPSFAQQKSPSNPVGGNLTASSTNCTVAQSCVWQQLPNNANTAAVTLAGTFSETLLVEKSADGGNTFVLVDTLSAAGVTSYSVAGMTDIRVRTSAFVSGSAAVTINTGLNTGQTGPAGPAGSSGSTAAAKSVIYALDYTSFSGKVLWTCSWTNTSPTITCPSGTFSASDVGKQAFATSLPSTGFTGFNGSVLSCGLVGSATTIATFTDSAHVNLSRNCTATQSVSNPFFFGPDETTGLTALTAAANAACATVQLPNGFAYTTAAQFGNAPAAACVNPVGGNRTGPDIYGTGPGESQIVMGPNFNWGSCTNGDSSNVCFFGSAGGAVHGGWAARFMGITGLGVSNPANTAGQVVAQFESNTYAYGLDVTGIGANAANQLICIRMAGYPINLDFVQGDGCGTISLRAGNGSGLQSVEHSYFGDNICAGANNGGSLDLTSGNLASTQNIWGPCFNTNSYVIDMTGSGIFDSDQDQILASGAANATGTVGLGLNVAGAVFNIHQMFFPANANGDSDIFLGISGAQLHLDHTKIAATGTGKILNTVAGTTFYDDCGNVFTNAGANVLSGAIVNCPTEPSFGGRCLLASAASPLACGSSPTGKVAVPVSQTTYTINTLAVASGSAITVTPTTDNTGISGSPTCGAEVFGDGAISASVANTSFTFAQTSAAVIKCYEWSIR
jgi:hypothetical protein